MYPLLLKIVKEFWDVTAIPPPRFSCQTRLDSLVDKQNSGLNGLYVHRSLTLVQTATWTRKYRLQTVIEPGITAFHIEIITPERLVRVTATAAPRSSTLVAISTSTTVLYLVFTPALA